MSSYLDSRSSPHHHDEPHEDYGGLHRELRASGLVNVTSIFPACYSGRWPHIHFEVFPSLASATNVAERIATSQIALPKATCDLVYATTGYAQSISSLSQISLASDDVFSNGAALELATCTGNVTSGISATLTIGV